MLPDPVFSSVFEPLWGPKKFFSIFQEGHILCKIQFPVDWDHPQLSSFNRLEVTAIFL